MSSPKGEARTERVSVTQRPATAQIVEEMTAATHLPKSDIYSTAVDVLHFVWSVLRKGGTIGVKFPGEEEYKPVRILLPGMIKPSFD